MAGPSNEPPGGPAASEADDQATVEVIALNTEAALDRQQVGDMTERARVLGMHIDNGARAVMVLVMCALFIGLNFYVMSFVEDVFKADTQFLTKLPAGATPSRVVTTEVLMSLIGSTAVQVGVAIVTIVAYLFPKNRGGNE
jgi:hypothetical protein